MLVTAGQAGDSPQFTAVLDGIAVPKLGGGRARVRPVRVLADKAYSSRGNREWLRRHRIRATIPVPSDQAANRLRRGRAGGRPPTFDPVIEPSWTGWRLLI
ncbi:transposase [Nocardia gipuzkoensis]|nr:transposase [Nocardia gipuzkoensis]MDE1675548.1 transposase [Nocardia gipuzkoensis]